MDERGLLTLKSIIAIFIFMLLFLSLLSFVSDAISRVLGDTSSFDSFVDELESVHDSGEIGEPTYITAEIPKGSAYIGMNPEADFSWDTSTYDGPNELLPAWGSSFTRPEQCGTSTCLCHCKQATYKQTNNDVGEVSHAEIQCGDLSCKSVSFSFPESVELDAMFADTIVEHEDPTDEDETRRFDFSKTTWEDSIILTNAYPQGIRRDVETSVSGFQDLSQVRDVYVIKEDDDKLRLCFDPEVCL